MIPRSIAREPGNWQMNLENSWLPSQSKRLVGNARRISLLLVLISSHLVGGAQWECSNSRKEERSNSERGGPIPRSDQASGPRTFHWSA
jgi:hypothetical protein